MIFRRPLQKPGSPIPISSAKLDIPHSENCKLLMVSLVLKEKGGEWRWRGEDREG
jgi:hypothetical protein